MSRKDDGPRWSKGKVVKSTSLDGAMDSMAGGRDRWYSFQGRADDRKAQGGSVCLFLVSDYEDSRFYFKTAQDPNYWDIIKFTVHCL